MAIEIFENSQQCNNTDIDKFTTDVLLEMK